MTSTLPDLPDLQDFIISDFNSSKVKIIGIHNQPVISKTNDIISFPIPHYGDLIPEIDLDIIYKLKHNADTILENK